MGDSEKDVDAVLDTLAGVLSDYGQFSFDLEQQQARHIATLFDSWAQHLSAGAAPPDAKSNQPYPLDRRDFNGARRAFQHHRKREQAEMGSQHDALKEVLWAFLSSANRVAAQDAREDGEVKEQLSQVRSALSGGSSSDLRKVALSSVERIQGLIDQRAQRQAEQLSQLTQKIDSLGSQLEIARRDSTVDALTQVYNRRAFDEHLGRTLTLSRSTGDGVLMMIDLDHFKKINDTYGHGGGDAALKTVASEIVRLFKRRGDFVARFGGEEFAVVLREANADEVKAMAERLCRTVEGTLISFEDKRFNLTASIGWSKWSQDASVESWVARADAALYRAKNEGRNRVVGDAEFNRR